MNPEFNSNEHNFSPETENKKVNKKHKTESSGETNEYDELVSENEIRNLKSEIEESVVLKANELGISKEELIDLTELDLESLEAEKLTASSLTRGNLDFIKSSISRSLNDFSKSEKPDVLSKESHSRFLEFLQKHRNKISLANLVLYLSAFGSPILKELAVEHATVDIGDDKISLEDLAKNPELMEKIDSSKNFVKPTSLIPSITLEHNDTAFSFQIEEKGDLNMEKMVSFKKLSVKGKELENFNNDLKDIGMGWKGEWAGQIGSLDDFLNNEEKIIKIISKDFSIPEHEIKDYFDKFKMLMTTKISVVPFEKFKIETDKQTDSKDLSKKIKYFKEIKTAYEKDFIVGGEEYSKFEKLFLEKIAKEGETIEHLKEIAKDDPKEVIKIISEIIDKNVNYDYEFIKTYRGTLSTSLSGDSSRAYSSFEEGKTICGDNAAIFLLAIYVLEQKGVPNLDRIMVISTYGEKIEHGWNNLIFLDEDGNFHMTSSDLTWADDENTSKIREKLNAVNAEHYYTKVIEKVDESHQKALEMIQRYNELVRQEELREILTTYDPKLHQKEQEIKQTRMINPYAF